MRDDSTPSVSRRTLLAGAGTTASLSVAGCLGQLTSSGSGGVTLQARHFATDGVESFYEKHAAKFEEETGIAVELETMGWGNAKQKQLNSITSRDGPDVEEIASTWMPQQIQSDAWLDLDELDISLDGVFDQPTGIAEYDGVTAGFPWFWGPRGHLMHGNMLEEAGISDAPGTWDELVEQGEQFSDAHPEKNLFGLPGANNWAVTQYYAMLVWQAGGSLLSEDNSTAQFDSDRAVEALNFYKDLATTHGVAPESSAEWDGPARDSAFINGRIASTWSALNTVDRVVAESDATRESMSVAKPPVGPGGSSATFYGVNLVGIHPWTNHEDEAAQWLEYLMRPSVNAEIAANTGFLPTIEDGFEQEQFAGELYQTFADEVLPVAQTFPQVLGWGQVEGIMKNAVTDVLTSAVSGGWSEGDTRDALETAAEQANSVLDEN
ncbi:extracellular solute-binding protein [Haloarchaeobius iranensis]|uniref:Multiple sugar transport system substrate-binding protein n=1 Tax=Haloarchaeobius iranensis TaxID=996166 RepID=A0A1G9UWV7_9EURY|nr:extracellular solute-binding protein [Haloarchaeobius iranensis]SDM64267.1 multiple sugar transport system substrate-binding protein [Haloarchaeobius iranensis]